MTLPILETKLIIHHLQVRLVIHREDDEIYETVEVELQKKRERGLGLSIVGKKSGPGVFISEVVKGGAADLDGRLIQVQHCLDILRPL